MKKILLIALLILLVIGVGYYFSQKSPIQPEAKTISFDDLKNSTYTLPNVGEVLLADGIHYIIDDRFNPEPNDDYYVSLSEIVKAFGDIDGDGDEDALVILHSRSGGTGSFRFLAAMLNQDGIPSNVSSVFLGDRVEANSISIHPDGIITVNMLTHGEIDPLCCPTLTKDFNYSLLNGELVEQK